MLIFGKVKLGKVLRSLTDSDAIKKYVHIIVEKMKIILTIIRVVV